MSKEYKRNFLKNVIFRIDFFSDEKVFEQIMSKKNIDELKTKFEILEPLQTIKNTDFTFNLNDETIKTNERELKKYIFRKKNQSAALIIEPNALVIDYSKYNNSEVLKDDITVLKTIVSNVSISRIGLRYINYLECTGFGDIAWEKYINSQLLENQKINYNGTLLQSITVSDIKFDDYIIRFQHGIHNQYHPSDRVKDAFVLDFDAYTNNIVQNVNLEEIVAKWNKQINDLFEQSITDDFRGVLDDVGAELQLKEQ